MKIGDIIEFIDEDEILLGCVLQIEIIDTGKRKKENIRVVTEKNKILNVSSNKIINTENGFGSNITKDTTPIVEKLLSIKSKRNEIVSQIPLKEVRELLQIENVKALTAKEIALTYFGNNATNDEISAMIRCLYTKNPFFKRKDEYFLLATDEEIEMYFKQIDNELKRQKHIEEFKIFIKKILDNQLTEDEFKEFLTKFNYEIELFKNYILFEENFSNYNKFKEIFNQLNLFKSKLEVFKFLIKINIFNVHENFALKKYNLKESFSNAVINETEEILKKYYDFSKFEIKPYEELLEKMCEINDNIAESYFDISQIIKDNTKIDMRNIPSITIDASYTTCCDDGIGYIKYKNSHFLFIHISDVVEFIHEESKLNEAIKNKPANIYLADKKIDMLPDVLANDYFSLSENKDRLAITLVLKIDENLNIKSWTFVPTIIKIRKKCSYEEIEEIYNKIFKNEDLNNLELIFNKEDYELIYKIAQNLHKLRKNNEAFIVYTPQCEVYVSFNEDNTPNIKLYSNYWPISEQVVSEFMILYNTYAGILLMKNNAVGYFKKSNKFQNIQLLNEYYLKLSELNINYEPVLAWKLKQFMEYADSSYEPGPHQMLGVSCYVQASSPVRRYIDILHQRQIKSIITNNKPYYDLENFSSNVNYAEASFSAINEAEQESYYYWMYYYLSLNLDKDYFGIIVDVTNDRYRIEMQDLYIHLFATQNIHGTFELGEKVKIKIISVDPRNRKIDFQLFKLNN